MTAAGLEALHAELAELKAKRPALVERVATARSHGDLRENFAYHDARQELGMLDGRMQVIENTITHAHVTEGPTEAGVARLGSTVLVRDEFGEATYSLVGPAEADLARGKVSVVSPLGSGLVDARAGDIVAFDSPGGRREVEVLKVD